jgi:hypothetical protein
MANFDGKTSPQKRTNYPIIPSSPSNINKNPK